MSDEKILALLESINQKLSVLESSITYTKEEIDALQKSVNDLNMLNSDTNNKIRDAINLLASK
jgi:hypothetical protein